MGVKLTDISSFLQRKPRSRLSPFKNSTDASSFDSEEEFAKFTKLLNTANAVIDQALDDFHFLSHYQFTPEQLKEAKNLKQSLEQVVSLLD